MRLSGIEIAKNLNDLTSSQLKEGKIMKKGPFLVILMLGLTVLGGCGGTTGRTVTQETQDPYFRPKRVYAVDMNQAWDLTLKAMNREGIPLEMVNKETGVIRTDYQNGQAGPGSGGRRSSGGDTQGRDRFSAPSSDGRGKGARACSLFACSRPQGRGGCAPGTHSRRKAGNQGRDFIQTGDDGSGHECTPGSFHPEQDYRRPAEGGESG
jgi:hypothetical protein